MCGIAGIYGKVDAVILRRMADILTHRGPDDSGMYLTRFNLASLIGVGLAHRRLSIIDLSERGRQPLANEDGSIQVICNGEIYNFPELRAELERQGHRFRSDSDSEVLVHLYEEKGVEMLNDLNGIFAFALWDDRNRRLLLGRDRFGVKPLYYCQVGEDFLFASEIKALLEHPSVKRSVCLEALRYYIAFRYVPDPLTMFDGILKLLPGHYCLIEDGHVQFHCYWRPQYAPNAGMNEEEAIEELRERLAGAVKRQLLSDVPLGLSFSGGVDSGAVLAMMHQVGVEGIKAYTVGYPDRESDLGGAKSDITYARRLGQQFGVQDREIMFDPQTLTDVLPKVIWHMDDPLPDTGAVASFLVAQLAQGEVKVLLSGQGGDEMFGGYPWHRAAKMAMWLRQSPVAASLLRWIGRPLQSVPVALGGRQVTFLRRLKKFAAHAHKDFAEGHLGFLSYADEEDRKALLAPLFNGGADAPFEIFLDHLMGPENLDPVHRALNLDMHAFLPSHNLLYGDKTSMAHSIELRVPLLDNDLFDFVATIPQHLKVSVRQQKYILKKALEGRLPHDALYRKKSAFGVPIRFWLTHYLKEMVNDLLSETSIHQLGYFDPLTVRQLIKANETGARDAGPLVFSLLTFALWHQTFINSGSRNRPDQPDGLRSEMLEATGYVGR
ncbi:MAG: asparagine synthase (glutamine-hydrolyzing) [Acidobacteria bacterium]|nr:asparagine synthase (glutamine-hydrolyzing) [Acidobacteriota bacterium]